MTAKTICTHRQTSLGVQKSPLIENHCVRLLDLQEIFSYNSVSQFSASTTIICYHYSKFRCLRPDLQAPGSTVGPDITHLMSFQEASDTWSPQTPLRKPFQGASLRTRQQHSVRLPSPLDFLLEFLSFPITHLWISLQT